MNDPETSQQANTEVNDAQLGLQATKVTDTTSASSTEQPVATPAPLIVLDALYQGTKRLLAMAMTRGEYNKYRGWDMPEGEDPSDEGYLVEYVDGGSPNDDRHKGYISWSPKDVFERTYQLVPAADLPPHQQRVVQEAAELADRGEKLQHFIQHNPTFGTLPINEQDRMRKQLMLMRQLFEVLQERIAAF